jgi:hypothetical protein
MGVDLWGLESGVWVESIKLFKVRERETRAALDQKWPAGLQIPSRQEETRSRAGVICIACCGPDQ